MDKINQVELAKKLEVVIENRLGPHYGFSHNGTDKSVTLKITSSDEKYVNWAKKFVKDHKLPRRNCRKNHGSGMNNTILINVGGIVKEEQLWISEKFSEIMLEKGKRKPGGIKRTEVVISKEQTDESITAKKEVTETVPVLVVKEETGKALLSEINPQRKKRDASYGLRKYISYVLKFEGFSLKDIDIKFVNGFYNLCTDNEEVRNIILHASAWYCQNIKAVALLEEKKGETPCVVVNLDERLAFSVAKKKFGFCSPPKKEEDTKKVSSRIERILHHNNFTLQKVCDGIFNLIYKEKKPPLLRNVMREMHWNVRSNFDDLFLITIYVCEEKILESVAKKEEIIAPVDNVVVVEEKKEKSSVFSNKSEAFCRLEAFFESEEFQTLDAVLKSQLRKVWREKIIKEDPARYARLIMDYLKE